jgi:hypothetical protein
MLGEGAHASWFDEGCGDHFVEREGASGIQDTLQR